MDILYPSLSPPSPPLGEETLLWGGVFYREIALWQVFILSCRAWNTVMWSICARMWWASLPRRYAYLLDQIHLTECTAQKQGKTGGCPLKRAISPKPLKYHSLLEAPSRLSALISCVSWVNHAICAQRIYVRTHSRDDVWSALYALTFWCTSSNGLYIDLKRTCKDCSMRFFNTGILINWYPRAEYKVWNLVTILPRYTYVYLQNLEEDMNGSFYNDFI